MDSMQDHDLTIEYDGDSARHGIDVEYDGTVDYAVAEMPGDSSDESPVDDLSASMNFEVMAFGG